MNCDYRKNECTATGKEVGGKWICDNHLSTAVVSPAPDEADQALAQQTVEEFCDKWGWIPDPAMLLDSSERQQAALAQARKETWEKAAGHVIDEAGKVGQLMNAAADSARKEERAEVKSMLEDYFKHFFCTCHGSTRTGGHFANCPVTIRDEVLGRLAGLESASKVGKPE